jgi:hypothetical protein
MRQNMMDPLLPHLTGVQLARMMTTSTQTRNRIQSNAKLMAKVKGSKRYHQEARERVNNRTQRAEDKRRFLELVSLFPRLRGGVKELAGNEIIHLLKTHNKNSARMIDAANYHGGEFSIYGVNGIFKRGEGSGRGYVIAHSPSDMFEVLTNEPTIFTNRNRKRNYFSTGGRNLRNVFTNHVD